MVQLSDEQQQFVDWAQQGHNILVDACIGSGKTTAIQSLCQQLPANRSVLYLTYNRLLKLDAQHKITQPNVNVTNYHGFAYQVVSRAGLRVGMSDLITTVNRKRLKIPHYDVMILDEYQDIETEIAEMLQYIKQQNPLMQIIAVGDMQQKIYDKTTLAVSPFIHELLDDPLEMEFTQCFRLPKAYAGELGQIWQKKIVGVNPDCQIQTMDYDEAIHFLADADPKQVLCLGQRQGEMADALNWLEDHTYKYNKNTVFASIRDGGNVYPKDTDAIFTTYDSSKGMERDICVIFDYNARYLELRATQPNVDPQIIKNIFMVAASRGKRHIVFVEGQLNGQPLPKLVPHDFTMLDETDVFANVPDQSMDDLFAFKYREALDQAFSMIETNVVVPPSPEQLVQFKDHDGLIDLSPCIKYDLLANYFHKYSLTHVLEQVYMQRYHHHAPDKWFHSSLERTILGIVFLQTMQKRYMTQVELPIMDVNDITQMSDQLDFEFDHDQMVMAPTQVTFGHQNANRNFVAYDTVDVIKDRIGYQIVCVDTLSHDDLLGAAMKLIGCVDIDRLIIWNVANGERIEVMVPDVTAFLKQVLVVATKGNTDGYQIKVDGHQPILMH